MAARLTLERKITSGSWGDQSWWSFASQKLLQRNAANPWMRCQGSRRSAGPASAHCGL